MRSAQSVMHLIRTMVRVADPQGDWDEEFDLSHDEAIALIEARDSEHAAALAKAEGRCRELEEKLFQIKDAFDLGPVLFFTSHRSKHLARLVESDHADAWKLFDESSALEWK